METNLGVAGLLLVAHGDDGQHQIDQVERAEEDDHHDSSAEEDHHDDEEEDHHDDEEEDHHDAEEDDHHEEDERERAAHGQHLPPKSTKWKCKWKW